LTGSPNDNERIKHNADINLPPQPTIRQPSENNQKISHQLLPH